MGRAPCCDKGKVKKGPWSPEEDDTLKIYLAKHGSSGNWIALPHKAGLNRCGKSCRLRWLNYLRPDIKHGGFTDEEDSVILTLYTNIGSRWSIIASHLPGRTDNDVKNYWNTKLKKKLNHNSNNNSNNNNNNNDNDIIGSFLPKIGDTDSYNSSLSLQDKNIVKDVEYYNNDQNYLNFGSHDYEEQSYFDQAMIGQVSSHSYSVSDFINMGAKGNHATSSSNSMMNIQELCSSTDHLLTSSVSSLGSCDDRGFATWCQNGNDDIYNIHNISSYYYYGGFDSRNDDALLSDFGF